MSTLATATLMASQLSFAHIAAKQLVQQAGKGI